VEPLLLLKVKPKKNLEFLQNIFFPSKLSS
jgi:hypothetical protein